MFKKLTIKSKLIIISAFGLISMALVITFLSVKYSSETLLDVEFEKLIAVENSKKGEILNYFNYLKGLLISLAAHEGTKEAFISFENGFYKLSKEIDLNKDFLYEKIKDDFKTNFLDSVDYTVPNASKKRDTESYIPKSLNAMIAQYIFIVDNNSKLGEKNKLVNNSKYKSTYMQAHEKYHKTFDTFLNSYSLYDIFMVDLKGNLIYTDFKEKDYATNLKTGIYSNTGIAKVYKKALKINEGQVAFDDFVPYEPSYNSPAAFIATPIFIKGSKKGVLIFQMPVDQINNIMQFGGNFEEAGLGESGEIYLVGKDYKMRSNSRFQKEIDDKVVKKLGTTIGVWDVKTKSVDEAFAGNSGKWIIPDYRNIDVLSVYSTVDILGQVRWAIISEIDKEEALATSIKLQNLIVISSIIILILLIFINIFFLNLSFIKPLKKFQNGILEFFRFLNKETKKVKLLDDKKDDELGLMSKEVNKNIKKIEKTLQSDAEFINEVKDIFRKVNQGIFKQEIKNDTLNEELSELKSLLNEMLNTLTKNISVDLNDIQKALEYYQNLNFTYRLKNCKGKTEIGLNSLSQIINEMLVENKNVGLNLQESSNILFKNVESLSKASNQAAASIEETAAAIEKITSSITSNTNNIVKMSNNANEVNEFVNKGQDLASQTTNAMDDINKEVMAINESIGLIDQIAFQTNILSLNAAVEAATAGEAGKGFAIVAQEVRNLANRSADVAREIKELVENATNKASSGKKISDEMSLGYEKLNESISTTLEIIKDVENSSQEQKRGIEQINNAINSLDQQTQQNASVASNTKQIAEQTQLIAKKVVEKVNEKEFIGK